MDYKKVYDSIISKRQNEIPQGYKERHHIIPRSFGGTNEKENLVYLTAREHFLCHYLLIKINKSGPRHYKAIHAFMMMNVTCSEHQRITSRLFEKYRIEFSKIMSEIQGGEKNSQYGKRWITNGEEETKIPKENVIPEGWVPGRKNKVREDARELGLRSIISSETRKKMYETRRLNPKPSRKREVKSFLSSKIVSCKCEFCGKEFEHDSKKKFCHQDCKNNSQKGSSLDEFVDQFIESFEETGSINKSLKSIGKCGSGDYYKWAVNVLDSRNIERQQK